jgi:hypothetical protein
VNGSIPLAHFGRGKPFYPLVMQYALQLVGFKELAIRGAMGGADIKQAVNQVVGLPEQKAIAAANLAENLEKLLGPLELRSAVMGSQALLVPVDDIAKEVVSNVWFLSTYLMRSAGSVLILGHELCKDMTAHDTGPLWEFLRHCRNAAGHGGNFNLLHGEPKRPAKWRSLEILPALQGTPLFQREKDGSYFLGPADPILLLWDIEQAYPSLA